MGILRLSAAAVALLASFGYAAPSSPISSIDKRALKFDFGGEKVRGVNLGGWFVLEPWITPSIFEATPDSVVDEYTFCQVLGKTEAEKRLQAHWSSFYSEDDFAQMSKVGLNMVRIPIGYWSITPLDGDPYVQGAYEHLGNAVEWAGNHGIKVLIDLHGAQGSQNGFDNSGRRGAIDWTKGDTVTQTKNTLNKIRDDYANNPTVAAIELVNEPLGPDLDMNIVRQFYYDGWGNLRYSPVAVVFHDAFEGVDSWNSFGAGMANLVEDTHHYEVFDSGLLKLSPEQHVNTACAFGGQMAKSNKWTIAGEWTGAMTDCAKWLNGRGYGARYDGSFTKDGQGSSYIGSCAGKSTGTVAAMDAALRSSTQNFIKAQMAAFEKAAGWIFWTWKNEAAPEWHFQNLTEAGIVPQPLSSAASSGICG